MSDKYILVGHSAVPEDDLMMAWAQWFETGDRSVAQTDVFGGLCHVSTVFLGLDYSFGQGRPLLFETMAFWDGEDSYEQTRSGTWEEAELAHQKMCREVSRPSLVWRYAKRLLRQSFTRAIQGLKRFWQELRGQEPTELESMLYKMQDREEDQRDRPLF